MAVCSTGSARVFDLATGNEIGHVGKEDSVQGTAFNRNGNLLAAIESDGAAHNYDLKSGGQLSQLQMQGEVRQVAFGPDEQFVAATSRQNTLDLFVASSGKQLRRLASADADEEMPAVAVSPDGRYVVVSLIEAVLV